jgi:hypothetical protein
MNKEGILAAQRRVLSQQKAATSLALRPITGIDREYEAETTIENANTSDALQRVREWQFQVEPGELKQAEGKEVITAYT